MPEYNPKPMSKPVPKSVPKEDDQRENLSIKALIGSIFAAFLGVRKSKKGDEDFTKGRPMVFIVAGIIGTLLFILTLVLIVSLVIP